MEKKKKQSVVKICLIIALFVAAVVLSAVTANKIAINYNLADYLGDDTQTKIALDIVDDEFGMTGNIQVMVKNVSVETAEEISDEIEAVDNVLNVNFDRYDEAYYRDGNALYIVIVDGDDYSDNAKQVAADIEAALEKYDGVEYGGTTIEKQDLQDGITSEMNYILAISLCLVLAILLICSESWLEPFVLLISSGAAVLINRGTNAMFGEISYITNSISAILQLALSVDYSIVLLHSYRREKEKFQDNGEAMKSAVKSVVKPVSASALTTIAGLLALLFMSFRIGFDIGIVLMKGIVISAITSLTLLPALVLLCDKPMRKTKKKAFVPKGRIFCKTAFKASKIVVPVALAVIVACGVLQTGNTFIFSDSDAGNAEIEKTFGSNNSVVVVYKNTENNYENEQKLADILSEYKTSDGKSVLTDYSAYTNTVREEYDVKKAVQKLEISESDAEMLFTMYNLYRDADAVTMTFSEFVDFAAELTKTDADAKEFTDADTVKTLDTMKVVSELTTGEFTSGELHGKLTTGVMSDNDIDEFSVKQLYGLYFYDEVENKAVDFKTMLNFTIAAASDENFKGAFDEATVTELTKLSAGIEQYEAYYPETDELRQVIDGAYGYEQFLPVLAQVAASLSEDGQPPQIAVTDQSIQQIYIVYFYRTGAMPDGKLGGKTFAGFALSSAETNPTVDARLTAENKNKLADIVTTADYLENTTSLNFKAAYEKLSALKGELKSDTATAMLDEDKVSGVYIKFACNSGSALTSPIMACDLLDFVDDNMEINSLLSRKMTDDNREKVADAQSDVKKAKDLFLGENYSRMLLSVDLPNESKETTEFVDYLSKEVKTVFGDDAYITGEIVSTYDLEKSFDHDNLFITIFTLVSIFVIVMLIFRSVSLPVILVAIIQGAIFIAMSTQLLSNGIFFMSYIVTTCILMGATIDYGILMSSNYVAFRDVYDKKKALEMSVEAAMPTVFSSGLILTVCGFVIHFISGQNSISTVGLLLGIGTICSVVMITVVLPSVLYLLDKFVLALSIKKKKRGDENSTAKDKE